MLKVPLKVFGKVKVSYFFKEKDLFGDVQKDFGTVKSVFKCVKWLFGR